MEWFHWPYSIHRNPQKLFERPYYGFQRGVNLRSDSPAAICDFILRLSTDLENILYDTTMLCKIFEGRVRELLKRSSGAKIKYSFSRPRFAQYLALFGWVSLSETPFDRLYLMFWWAKSINKKCHSDMTWGAGPSLVSLQIYSFCSQLTHFSDASSPFFL